MGLCLEKQFDGANKFVFMPPIPAKCRAINKPGNPRGGGEKGRDCRERERERSGKRERERDLPSGNRNVIWPTTLAKRSLITFCADCA